MPTISPSIYAADLTDLRGSAAMAQRAGAGSLHVDVMDGHFVPGFGFSAPTVRALKSCTALPVEVHLQTHAPQRYVDDFLDAGADCVTFHPEAAGAEAEALLEHIRSRHARAGLALSPHYDLACAEPLLSRCDEVLLLGVRPGGYPGDLFRPQTYGRIEALRALAMRNDLALSVAVDGALGLENGRSCLAHGAEKLIIGKAFFGAADPAAFLNRLLRPV